MAELGHKRLENLTVYKMLKKANIPVPLLYDDEFEAKLISLASGPPPTGASGWTLKSLADKMAELGYNRLPQKTVEEILQKANISFRRIYDHEFRAKLVSLASGPPPTGTLKWTRKLLADKMAELGYKRPHPKTITNFLLTTKKFTYIQYDDDYKAKLISLASGPPPAGLFAWTINLLADKMAELGYKRANWKTVTRILQNANISISPIYDDEFKAKLIALRNGPPPPGVVKWTLSILADKMAELGYKRPDKITVHHMLKKANVSIFPIYDDDYQAKLISLASGPPPTGASRWTLVSLADKMAELGYKYPDKTTVKRLLKKGNISSNPIINNEYKAKLLSLASEPPPAGALKWTVDSLADRMAELGYQRPADSIVALILKNANKPTSPKYDEEFKAKLRSLASGPPPDGTLRWTLPSLADKMAELGYKRPSVSTVHVILKKGNISANQFSKMTTRSS
jgi:precorrin-4 methylase